MHTQDTRKAPTQGRCKTLPVTWGLIICLNIFLGVAFSHFGENILSHKLPIVWLQIFCWHNVFNILKHWLTGSRHLQEVLEKIGIRKAFEYKTKASHLLHISHKEKSAISLSLCATYHMYEGYWAHKNNRYQRHFLSALFPQHLKCRQGENQTVQILKGYL